MSAQKRDWEGNPKQTQINLGDVLAVAIRMINNFTSSSVAGNFDDRPYQELVKIFLRVQQLLEQQHAQTNIILEEEKHLELINQAREDLISALEKWTEGYIAYQEETE